VIHASLRCNLAVVLVEIAVVEAPKAPDGCDKAIAGARDSATLVGLVVVDGTVLRGSQVNVVLEKNQQKKPSVSEKKSQKLNLRAVTTSIS
jgi:hypothetical protein